MLLKNMAAHGHEQPRHRWQGRKIGFIGLGDCCDAYAVETILDMLDDGLL